MAKITCGKLTIEEITFLLDRIEEQGGAQTPQQKYIQACLELVVHYRAEPSFRPRTAIA